MIKLDGLVNNRCFKQLTWIAVFYFKNQYYKFIIDKVIMYSYGQPISVAWWKRGCLGLSSPCTTFWPHNPTWSRNTTSTQRRHSQHITYAWWIIFLCFFPPSTWNWIPTQGRSVTRIRAPRKTLPRTTGFALCLGPSVKSFFSGPLGYSIPPYELHWRYIHLFNFIGLTARLQLVRAFHKIGGESQIKFN